MSVKCMREALYQVECNRCGRLRSERGEPDRNKLYDRQRLDDWARLRIWLFGIQGSEDVDLCSRCWEAVRVFIAENRPLNTHPGTGAAPLPVDDDLPAVPCTLNSRRGVPQDPDHVDCWISPGGKHFKMTSGMQKTASRQP